MSQKTQIVILGAGYAGMMAAVRLAGKTRRMPVEITLVNASAHFVERVRLHQLATGQRLRQHPIERLLRGTGVRFVQGWVHHLNPNAQTIRVKTGDETQEIRYDYLVYALGSIANKESTPGVDQHTLSIGNPAEAVLLRERLPQVAAQNGRVLVVGGGLTGIETSTELAELYPSVQIHLLTSERVGAQLSEKGREHLGRVFKRLKIAVHESSRVSHVTADALHLASGETFNFDLCIWGASFVAPPLAKESDLTVNPRGQIIVDDKLRSLSHPTIYAAGDAAWAPLQQDHYSLRMACATGQPMAAHAVDNLIAQLKGEAQKPFVFGYFVQCISLGRRDGLIQFVHHDDSPKNQILTGWQAALFKESICRFAFQSINVERRLPGIYRWPKPRGAAAQTAPSGIEA